MSLKPFIAGTAIEQKIVDARTLRLGGDELILALAEADLFVPSQGRPDPGSSRFKPVVLELDGLPLIPAFTQAQRLPLEMATHAVQMRGERFFTLIPPGMGAVINPGYDAQLVLPDEGIAVLQADLKPAP